MNNTIELNKIVGEHLGKAGDGSAVNPYVTPDNIDSNLLVPVPRYLNREQYNIKEGNLGFEGMDVWNAYEVSCMLDNGYPLSGIMKITYDCASPSIVESKSLKLYLNSYNMVALGSNVIEATKKLEDLISDHLSVALKTIVVVKFFRNHKWDNYKTVSDNFNIIEDVIDLDNMKFVAFNEDPDILEILDEETNYTDRYTTNVLRSNCRVTNQPDWGDVFIITNGNKRVTAESLLKYIVSMRKENHFHEEICECIYKRLTTLMPNCDIVVTCLYTRRGGIDINPIRYNNFELALEHFEGLMDWAVPNHKTERQ